MSALALDGVPNDLQDSTFPLNCSLHCLSFIIRNASTEFTEILHVHTLREEIRRAMHRLALIIDNDSDLLLAKYRLYPIQKGLIEFVCVYSESCCRYGRVTLASLQEFRGHAGNNFHFCASLPDIVYFCSSKFIRKQLRRL